MKRGQLRGAAIDETCAVFITHRKCDRGCFCLPNLCVDDWGDRAVVVATRPCDMHAGCRILTVTPDGSETLESVCADDETRYAVDRP